MDKLDRLDWAVGRSIDVLGLRVGLRVRNPSALSPLLERVPVGWRDARSRRVDVLYSMPSGDPPGSSARRRLALAYVGTQRLARTMDFERALDAFESDLDLRITGASRTLIFVRAGVVAYRRRGVIVLGDAGTHTPVDGAGEASVGGSAGRSADASAEALADALVRAGATRYSNRFAALDARGRVHAYLRAAPRPAGRARAQVAALPSTTAAPRPVSVALIVSAQHREGASWRPHVLTPGQALLALLERTTATRRDPASGLALLRATATGARALRGVRGTVDEAAADLVGEIDRLVEAPLDSAGAARGRQGGPHASAGSR